MSDIVIQTKNVIQTIPKQPQAQYSTNEQLELLINAANRLGLYDAADVLFNLIKNKE